MDAAQLLRQYGEPDMDAAPLRIWVHGREWPDPQCSWLLVTVHCSTDKKDRHGWATGTDLWAEGPILALDELLDWADACERMLKGQATCATLRCLEPIVHVHIGEDWDMLVSIWIEGDDSHLEFRSPVSQWHLSQIIRGCERILRRYPLS